MRRLGLLVYIPCLTNCMPYHLLLPTNEKTGLTVYAMQDQPHTIHCHRPMRRLGLLNICHAGPTEHHPQSPTNEKTGLPVHVMQDQPDTIHCHRPMRRLDMYVQYRFMPHTGPAAINSSVTTHRYYRPMRIKQS